MMLTFDFFKEFTSCVGLFRTLSLEVLKDYFLFAMQLWQKRESDRKLDGSFSQDDVSLQEISLSVFEISFVYNEMLHLPRRPTCSLEGVFSLIVFESGENVVSSTASPLKLCSHLLETTKTSVDAYYK